MPLKGPLLLALLAFLVPMAVACGDEDGAGSLTVAAAADLRPVFEEIDPLFQQETGVEVTFIFGSSGLLRRQIQQGAPYDVLASANIEFIDRLREDGQVIADTQTNYAIGRLALVSTRADVRSLDDLLQPQVQHVSIANPEHAPYGRAAEEALRSAGLWDRLGDKIVLGENVGQAFQFVLLGQAEAGIVALSLAIADGVNYVEVNESLHRPIIQAAAVVAGTKREEAARRFVAFLLQPAAQAVFHRYGFLPLE